MQMNAIDVIPTSERLANLLDDDNDDDRKIIDV